jgi:hypothetical protein
VRTAGKRTQFHKLLFDLTSLQRKHINARIQAVNDSKQGLGNGIVDIASDAITLSLNSEAAGAVNT